MTDQQDNPLFEVDLGSFGGRIAPKDFRQFVEMATAEKNAWEWLADAEVADPALIGLRTNFINSVNSIVNYATQLEAAGSLNGQDPVGVLRSTWGGPLPNLFHSTGETGRALTAIGKSLGADAMLLGYGLLTAQIGVDVRNPLHFRIMSLIANPALIEPAALTKTNQEVLQQAQDEARRLHRRLLDMIKNDQTEWSAGVSSARRLAFKLLKKDIRLNRAEARKHEEAVTASIAAINNTRNAYEAQMQLRAAVQYWSEKANTHATKLSTAYKYLMRYIVGATFAALIVFLVATSFLLALSGVEGPFWNVTPPQGRSASPATYLIVSVAVGTVLSSLFWAAKVLLKNFLTERHLQRDAEERSVMTQTFLALIKEGGVKDEDRLVILNSLFRPSSDLPGSDDSPGEVTLPAIMARLLDAKR